MKLAYFVFSVVCFLSFDVCEAFFKNSDNPIARNDISDFLENVSNDTVVVINCKDALFSQADTIFVLPDSKKYWESLKQKRKNLTELQNKEMNKKIAQALLEKPAASLCDKLRSIKNKRGKIVLFFPTQNEVLLSSEGINSIKMALVSLTGVSEYWKSAIKVEQGRNALDIIVSKPDELYAQLQQLVSKISSEEKSQIKKIVVLSITNYLKFFQNKIADVPVSFKPIISESRNNFISDELINKQLDILIDQNVWFSDQVLKEYSGKSPEETVYEACTQKVLQICSCREVDEFEIYKFVSAILGSKNVPTHTFEVIDDFQVLKERFIEIALLAVKTVLINYPSLDQKKVFSAIHKTLGLEFIQEKEFANYEPFKILKRIGIGVHWKDIVAYDYAKFLINPRYDLKKPRCCPEDRYARFLKTLQIVANHLDLPNKIRKVKEALVQNLLKEGITLDQISAAYNFRKEDLSEVASAAEN